MPAAEYHASAPPDALILDEAEVARRKLLLAELQAALTGAGLQCTLTCRHRLVLRYSDEPPHAPSGPTDPALHVFGRIPDVITTNGTCYRLRNGQEFPISDHSALAAAISS